MKPKRKIVLVGHCGPDAQMLKSAISRAVPRVSVSHANDERRLEEQLTPDSLLLINRVLDGDFCCDSGVGLIELLIRRPDAPAMMLVSNYADAQDHAVAAGAVRGFGKTQLYNDGTAALLRQAICCEDDVAA